MDTNTTPSTANRVEWTEKRNAFDVDAYVADLRTALPLYPGNMTVELVSIDGVTKTGRTRFTIRLAKDGRA